MLSSSTKESWSKNTKESWSRNWNLMQQSQSVYNLNRFTYVCIQQFTYYLLRLFMCSRIISFCFLRHRLQWGNAIPWFAWYYYVDFSSAALTEVMHVPPVPLVCLHEVVGELAGELRFFLTHQKLLECGLWRSVWLPPTIISAHTRYWMVENSLHGFLDRLLDYQLAPVLDQMSSFSSSSHLTAYSQLVARLQNQIELYCCQIAQL